MGLTPEQLDRFIVIVREEEDSAGYEHETSDTLFALRHMAQRIARMDPSISYGYPVIKCRFCEHDVAYQMVNDGWSVEQEHEDDCLWLQAQEWNEPA